MFAQSHLDFRLAELDALAKLESVDVKYNPSELTLYSPFLKVLLRSRDDAIKLVTRSILIKSLVRIAPKEQLEPYMTCSFKFLVTAFGNTLTVPEQVERIERFSFLPFTGEINLKTPDVTFKYYEDYGDYTRRGLSVPLQVSERCYFGVMISIGNRAAVQTYDLKKREYLGTTSMDAELSLLMANQGLVREGSLVLDPFVGTGSILVASSAFGAFTLGSDIDGRQIRGKGLITMEIISHIKDDKNLMTNVVQYNQTQKFLGTIVTDIGALLYLYNSNKKTKRTTPGGRMGGAMLLFAMAGAKKIGVNSKFPPKTTFFKPNGEPKLPQTVPYELHEVIIDLVSFAADILVPGGRVVYWLPTLPDEYHPSDIPSHPRLRLVANSEQFFGKWARRLITMEKIEASEPDLEWDKPEGDEPAHSRFRNKYFRIGQYFNEI
ncbi:hypothetical protein HDU97_000080 [Phlyctochytrium planicorne]|nr:hypothetical protein HDU97_000080 [Phlyctochytrium planicorne]